ncbi:MULTISPECIES: cytochrome c biogenesis CcdA family protein [Fusobacterium]|uniref:cytochrome c biogenesis CcdA family protein n=1 Tax=Fusobacterium TaxID=848 RepID=UPI0025C32632|nr:cytochrome c biogenesis CcdA family protein [Fusobacterium sp.]MCI7222979.1 cytochrome c biogenesis CcdA family protein [Fusobacterium sp.]MDD7410040.1 cytochrome c biogenesis CcdA family protein [Fusobacteriaceae bacterium]MDY5712400.1 cytochrome c biogenesis CcdA family protein [Fusobacterium gastrosuis]
MYTEEILYSSIYFAGILSFFSPCIFPVIPVYLSILSNGEKKSIIKTIMFILGLSLTFLVLGFGMGLLGELFFNDQVRLIAGIVIIILGFVQMDIIKIKFLEKTKFINIQEQKNGILTAFILGLTFSLGWTPCVGPVLASILFISGSSADIGRSILMMSIYVLGLATPFIVFSMASKVLFEKVKFIKRYLGILKKIGGFIIIIMGILLIFNKINMLATL